MMTASEALEVHLAELQRRFSRIGGSGWQDKAVCKGLPLDLFYPEDSTERVNTDKVINGLCKRCTVKNECLQMGLLEGIPPFGLHGGRTSTTLRKLAPYREKIMNPRTPKPDELAHIIETRLHLTSREAWLAKLEATQAIDPRTKREKRIEKLLNEIMELKKELMRSMEVALGIYEAPIDNAQNKE